MLDDQLLTVAEVAAYLRKDRRTLYRWRADHRGPAYLVIGNAIRYRQSALDAWLNRVEIDPHHMAHT